MSIALQIPDKKRLLPTVGIGVLVILHCVGIVGMHIESLQPLFRSLTPVNLLVSAGVVLAFHKDWNLKFLLASLGVFAFGYGIEVLGVHSGLIFGSYSYGSTLGWKVAEVPVLMGLNWWILIYALAKILQRFSWPLVIKAIVGALGMVCLDLFMEPVAVRYDFWQWVGNHIPVQNYLAWGVASFLLFLAVLKPLEGNKNPVAGALFVIQFCFFAGFALVGLFT